MTTILLILAAWVTVPTVVLVVGAWLIEHADAEQGPPPTLRPDPLDEYAETWDEAVAQAMRLAEPTPVYDALVCEDIERAEGWA